MNPGLLQNVIDIEWGHEDALRGRPTPDVLYELSDYDEDTNFEIGLFIPAEEPRLAFLVESLTAIERRIRLAFLFTFLKPDQIDRFQSIESLLSEFQSIPLRITSLTMSSVKVTIEGKADEIAQIFGHSKPPRSWRRKLLTTLATLLGGGILVLTIAGVARPPVNVPPEVQVRERVEQTCGYVPPGTVLTIKAGPVEAEIPCPDAGDDTSNPP